MTAYDNPTVPIMDACTAAYLYDDQPEIRDNATNPDPADHEQHSTTNA